ncbi:methyltransferase domain-containing protein [Candidatus Bathyarchaeota archaeon]|nr:methyltransferase domain-containing protein [Candidatus Bathyarchaeota archaeon]
MAILSRMARLLKQHFFLDRIPSHASVLEIGCGEGWVRSYLKQRGVLDYTGIDIEPPASIVGDIRDWESLGIERASKDVVIAFEVIEHVDCIQACVAILKSRGYLMATSPVPRCDTVLSWMERVGINQQRTSAHVNLLSLQELSQFKPVHFKKPAGIVQWAILRKRA